MALFYPLIFAEAFLMVDTMTSWYFWYVSNITAVNMTVTMMVAVSTAIAAWFMISKQAAWSSKNLDAINSMKQTLKKAMQADNSINANAIKNCATASIIITCTDGGFFAVDRVLSVDYGAATLAKGKSTLIIRYSEIGSIALCAAGDPEEALLRRYNFNG